MCHARQKRLTGAGLVILLNVTLAGLVHNAAPAAPRHSDRQAYEWVGAHAFEPGCGWSIYCYRVVVPVVLEQIAVDPETRWRWYQAIATAAAGTVTSLATWQFAGGPGAAIIAGVLAQTGYGFSFTAYDPYTADPLVFVFAAAIAWCWFADRWRLALVLGLAGIFVKETVALVSAACLLAALARRRPTWRYWIAAGAAVCVALIAFRWVMDTYFGWGVSANPAAQFASGSWLAVWWDNNPFLVRKLYLLFAPFAFGWCFAALGWRYADRPLRDLALGSVVPFLALCYVQTPERALSNAFFIVVPLAALFLSRVSLGTGLVAAVANGLATAKIGTSTEWLPPSGYLMIPALVVSLWVMYLVLGPQRVQRAQSGGPARGHPAREHRSADQ
jgi:hypothetical protein